MTTVRQLACIQVVELLTDYLEDALPSAAAAEVTGHLRACPDCATYLTEMRETIRVLGSLPAQPPSEQVRRRLQDRFRDWAADR